MNEVTYLIFVKNMRAICEVLIMTMMMVSDEGNDERGGRGVRRRIIGEEAYASSNKTECHAIVPAFCNVSQQGCIIVQIISLII